MTSLAIVSKATQVIADLKPVWSEIGLNATESNERLNEAKDKVLIILRQNVNELKQRQQHLQQKKLCLLEETRTMASQLHSQGHSVSPNELLNHLHHNEAQSLEQQCKQITEIIEGLRNKQRMLQTVLQGFIDRIHTLYKLLGTEITEEFTSVGSDLSSQRMQYVEAAFNQASAEKIRRTESVTSTMARIRTLFDELGIPKPDTDEYVESEFSSIDRCVFACTDDHSIGITSEDMQRLQAREQALQQQHQSATNSYARILSHIHDRCRAMELEESETDALLLGAQGLTSHHIAHLQSVSDSLDTRFTNRLADLCAHTQQRISVIRDSLRVDEYIHIDDSHLEECIQSVSAVSERFLEKLKQREHMLGERLSSLKPLLTLLAKRKSYRLEIEEGKTLAIESVNDPNRFRGRQAFKILRREEELRRLSLKTLPKLEHKIALSLEAWEKEHNQQLTSNGVSIAKILFQTEPQQTSKQQQDMNSRRLSSRFASPGGRVLPASSSRVPNAREIRRRNSSFGIRSAPTSRQSVDDDDNITLTTHTQQQQPLPSSSSSPSNIAQSAEKNIEFAGNDTIEMALKQADFTLHQSNSFISLQRLSTEISELETSTSSPSRNEKLVDAYHQRSVVHTEIGKYDLAVADSKRAMQLSESTHTHTQY